MKIRTSDNVTMEVDKEKWMKNKDSCVVNVVGDCNLSDADVVPIPIHSSIAKKVDEWLTIENKPLEMRRLQHQVNEEMAQSLMDEFTPLLIGLDSLSMSDDLSFLTTYLAANLLKGFSSQSYRNIFRLSDADAYDEMGRAMVEQQYEWCAPIEKRVYRY